MLLLLVLLSTTSKIYSQSSNIGIPPVFNFSEKQHKGSPQNWNIGQDKNGIVYFANNAGLLVFDGNNWSCHKVDNQTKVRSLAVDEKGRIYVGAEGEIGCFERDAIGRLQYTSLNHLIRPEARKFADVWGIKVIKDRIYFQTGSQVLEYKNGSIDNIFTSNNISCINVIDSLLYIGDEKEGIIQYDGQLISIFFKNSPLLNGAEIRNILPFQKNTLLVSTVERGVFLCRQNQIEPWTINDQDIIKSHSIYCAEKINDDIFAFGTSTNGVFLVNREGYVLHHINQEKGLNINNVLSLFADQLGNIWVGLDNGIDYIETSSPFSKLTLNDGVKTMGYSTTIHKDHIYLGTPIGLFKRKWQSYYHPIKASSYKPITAIGGQVWYLNSFEDDLFLNYHSGTFLVKGDNAIPISTENQEGSWTQLKVGENKLISGHYNGLKLLEHKGGWVESKSFFNDWRESCRVMELDSNGHIWVSHPYRGVFKVKFNPTYTAIEKIETYTVENGFPSTWQINVTKIDNEVLFCTQKGIYNYNEQLNHFEPNTYWNTLLGADTWVKKLIETSSGDIWYVTDKAVGVLHQDNGQIQQKEFPQLKDKLVDNFEHIYAHDHENVFISTKEGFIHYNPQQSLTDSNFQVLVRKVQLMSNDSIIYAGENGEQDKPTRLDHYLHDIRFQFSSTYFANINHNEFQYYLKGYDEKWSNWSTKSEIEYTNLNPGSYELFIKGRNINGTLSEAISYHFEIKAPWYWSTWAKLLYILLVIGIFAATFTVPRMRYEQEKAAMKSEQEKALIQKEKEKKTAEQKHLQQVSQLENEKLALQIEAKNQELASNTMHLAQKRKILKTIKSDLQKTIKISQEDTVVKALKGIVKKVSTDESLDDDWAQFSKHFDQVHGQFLQRLRVKYPKLKPNDYRLCAYLRMNLSTKEIARLMNISTRGAEVARYRLRKKLELTSEVNLVDFMHSV